MIYDLISIGSTTKDIFLLTDRGKIFKTPDDKLAPVWLGFELGEKISIQEIVESGGGVATNLSLGTKKLGLNSFPMGPAKPAISVIIVDKRTGERIIFYQKSSGAVKLKSLRSKKTKYLSVSSLTGNWSRQANEILAYKKKNKAKLIVAPSTSMIRDGFSNLRKLLKNTEILFLNKNEAIEIAVNDKVETSNVNNLIKFLHRLGPKIVCLTDGMKGAWASDGKNIFHSPIKKVKTIDVTGAGDAFAAGFLGVYIREKDIQKSLKMGISNSASVVRHIGTTKGLLKK